MSTPEGYEIRIICDKVAAHKSGKVQHVDTWEYRTIEDVGYSSWAPKYLGRRGEKLFRSRREYVKPPEKDQGVGTLTQLDSFIANAQREWIEMYCPRDRCKSDVVQAREESLAFVLDSCAALGRTEVTLTELRAMLDSKGFWKQLGSATEHLEKIARNNG